MLCPCCGYPTLTEASAYEICELCNWEDDGQGEGQADEVWGGPNGAYSLAEARRNFQKYLVMYAPDRDTRIAPDSQCEQEAKRALIIAFNRLEQVAGAHHDGVLAEIKRQETVLKEELHRKVGDRDSSE